MRSLFLAIAAICLCVFEWRVSFADGQSSSAQPIPELGRNLPRNFDEGNAEFKKRVRERFPAGEPEQDVVATLTQQGFKLSPDGRAASFEQPSLVCRLVWRVFWSVDAAHTIRHIDGVYGGICS